MLECSILWPKVILTNLYLYSCYRKNETGCYRKNETEKKRAYEERIRNVEHGTFTPLVFSVAGGMGPIVSTFYKCLASMLSAKTQQSYN